MQAQSTGLIVGHRRNHRLRAWELLSAVVMSANASTLSCMAAASTSPMEHVGAAPGLLAVERSQPSSFTQSAGSILSEDFPEHSVMLFVHQGLLNLLLVSQLFFPPGGISLKLEHHLIYPLLHHDSNIIYLLHLARILPIPYCEWQSACPPCCPACRVAPTQVETFPK